ncbi:uncharacterized protein G2W53_040316 [Senna tora]|uniref:DUF4216 domain-containing protein n=1 Tax=Senna tora TaxID=362788 RepID=A0A834SSJ1_9FABA|nr:uncharacterized protein G2W53_040316 [Senna tora]
MTWTQAHRYVLFHSEEISLLRQKHKDAIKRQHRPRRLSDEVVYKLHMENFYRWLRLYVEQNDLNGGISDEVRLLARGPNSEAKSFNKCMINGYSFRTKDHEASMKSQNSGVCVTTDDGVTYYRILKEIIELNYFDKYKVLLFRCDWVDVISEIGIWWSKRPKDLFHMGDYTFCESEPFVQQTLGNIVEDDNEHMIWTRSDMEGPTIDNQELKTNEVDEPNSEEDF